MSTAYYYVKNPPCDGCGRADPEVFIGHNAGGWQFCFVVRPYPRGSGRLGTQRFESWAEWRAFLAGVYQIRDEYGRVITLEDLTYSVEMKQGGRVSAGDYLDGEGYSMHDGWFC